MGSGLLRRFFWVQVSIFSRRRRRVAEVFAAKTSSRNMRCCADVRLAQRALASEFSLSSCVNSWGRSSEARRIRRLTLSPVSSFAFLHNGSGRSIHQHSRSSQRFRLLRPSSVSLIVPSTVAVPLSFHGATLSSGMVTRRGNCG